LRLLNSRPKTSGSKLFAAGQHQANRNDANASPTVRRGESIMDPQLRRYGLGMVVGLVPDLVVSWAAARLTDSGWSGFFITMVGLQAIYFFFWLKRALWAWLVFWVYGKRRMVAQLENFFIDSRFPAPGKYATDLDDYLTEIYDNDELDAAMRLKAAFELGALDGLKSAGRFSMFLQLNWAAGIALKRYAGYVNRFGLGAP
jgi:hypothetical protein